MECELFHNLFHSLLLSLSLSLSLSCAHSFTHTHGLQLQISTEFPEDILQERFRIQYKSDSDRFTRSRFYFLTLEDTLNITRKEFTYTIPFLQRDTAYTIEIRAEARYPIFPLVCFSYLLGNYSTPVVLRTNNTGNS